MNYWKYLTAGGVLALALWACGPDFGIFVLGTRKEASLAPPSFSFYQQLESLVAVPDGRLHLPEERDPMAPPVEKPPVTTEAGRRALAGLQAFHEGLWNAAKHHYSAILALPPAARRDQEVDALYMLGRIATIEGDRATATARAAEARAAALRGLPDPESVAIESFGEEALAAWNDGDLPRAVLLYAQQAAYGSERGVASLIIIARRIVKDPTLLDRAAADPLARKLVLVYLNARNDDEKLARVAAAWERQRVMDTPGVGLLAAAAYARGNFALAERLAARDQGAAAAWVRAKLALRRGDRETALQQYTHALEASRTAGAESVDAGALTSELGILRLGRQEYAQALDLMMRATSGPDPFRRENYWADVAYLAERVLTLDELRAYVDQHTAPAPFTRADEWDSGPPAVRLRALLGRRLMRAGRRDDAIAYFDEASARQAARDYRDALARAQSGWLPRAWRAEAWWQAAQLARHQGIGLLAFELAPDYATYRGNYQWPEDTPHAGATPDELRRVAANASPRPVRFHYRLTAVDHALQAANLVPARSEGFAAALCQATGWVVDRHPPTAQTVYQRYVKEGAWIPAARHFGHGCPAVRLESQPVWEARLALRQLSRRAGFDVIPGLALALSGLGLFALVKWLYRHPA